MVRKLRHHEQKLLKKVDLLSYSTAAASTSLHQTAIIRRYRLPSREAYVGYNRICGEVRKLAHKIAQLNPRDPFRAKQEKALLDRLYHMAVITSRSTFSACEKITVAAFCRRRLAIILCKLRMSETVEEAARLVEQGHVRVGPEMVTDPGFLVTREMEDFVTWVDASKIKRKVAKYNDKLDDFDMLA